MNRRREAAAHAREAALLQKLVRDRLMDVKDAVDAERAECDLADVDEKKDSVVAKLEWTARVVSLLYDRAFPAGKCPPRGCRPTMACCWCLALGQSQTDPAAEVRIRPATPAPQRRPRLRINLKTTPPQRFRSPGRSRSSPRRRPSFIVPSMGGGSSGTGACAAGRARAGSTSRWPHGTKAASFGASRQTAQRRASSSSWPRARARSAASARAAWRACWA